MLSRFQRTAIASAVRVLDSAAFVSQPGDTEKPLSALRSVLASDDAERVTARDARAIIGRDFAPITPDEFRQFAARAFYCANTLAASLAPFASHGERKAARRNVARSERGAFDAARLDELVAEACRHTGAGRHVTPEIAAKMSAEARAIVLADMVRGLSTPQGLYGSPVVAPLEEYRAALAQARADVPPDDPMADERERREFSDRFSAEGERDAMVADLASAVTVADLRGLWDAWIGANSSATAPVLAFDLRNECADHIRAYCEDCHIDYREDARRFVVGGGAAISLADFLSENEDDAEACAWALGAAIGDRLPDGEGCERVADATDTRRFSCHWSAPTYANGCAQRGADFFSDANGFDDADRAAILALRIDGAWHSVGLSVYRVA